MTKLVALQSAQPLQTIHCCRLPSYFFCRPSIGSLIRRSAGVAAGWCVLEQREAYQLTVHRRESELASLRDEWVALHSRSPDRVPYTSHDWITLCWKRHRDDPRSELFVVTVRAGDRLVFALPLRARREVFGFRVLSWIDSKTPFYSDLLLEDSVTGRTAAKVAALYLATDRSIVRIRLNLVPEEAAAHHLLFWLKGVTIRSSSRVGFIDLTQFAGPEDYFKRQRASLRYDFRSTMRLLADDGDVQVTMASSPGQIEKELSWLFATKTQQLAAKGALGQWFRAPETLEFFQSACKLGLSNATSALYTLKRSNSIIAAELIFMAGEKYYLSKSAIDRSLRGISPGTYLRMRVIMDAIRAGAKSVDFMMGEYPWKERMRTGTKTVAHYRVPGFYLSRLRRVQ